MTYKIAGEWVIGHIGEEGFDPDNKLLFAHSLFNFFGTSF